MEETTARQPCGVDERDGVEHQRVAFPAPHGITHTAYHRERAKAMPAAIQPAAIRASYLQRTTAPMDGQLIGTSRVGRFRNSVFYLRSNSKLSRLASPRVSAQKSTASFILP